MLGAGIGHLKQGATPVPSPAPWAPPAAETTPPTSSATPPAPAGHSRPVSRRLRVTHECNGPRPCQCRLAPGHPDPLERRRDSSFLVRDPATRCGCRGGGGVVVVVVVVGGEVVVVPLDPPVPPVFTFVGAMVGCWGLIDHQRQTRSSYCPSPDRVLISSETIEGIPSRVTWCVPFARVNEPSPRTPFPTGTFCPGAKRTGAKRLHTGPCSDCDPSSPRSSDTERRRCSTSTSVPTPRSVRP